ncbi:uncharacterized protein MONOS_12005 [Monocercomonoides exilis]|uniref:uncharacterized protein n=1 Tax=Monocercomonoides exilis TaxID=2049356 RepID=UPI00355959A4|nr:hypothetical protein MONOS_12005 [Monocercomonoides exilis]|eukprot:MONOS_12005.1-p1 / transcript=MONOS_12005.1 / gene=MONOS_12005 / organism=Monocercomonoides_exilis_PA203 / gene_product=unspecified product / transcript_product=unspecified product / location=Mono_scaffold00635:35512-39294(-) / protein_length=1261 / sequence_SO=supercontig / SO=protein_coding / is_pseudo=false
MFLTFVFLQVVLSIYADNEEGVVKEVFVQSGKNGTNGTPEDPFGKIGDAYNKLNDANENGYIITIIKQDDNSSALIAGMNAFDKNVSLMIRGKQTENKTIELVEINCTYLTDVNNEKENKDLFTCKQNVTFKYLKFIYPLSLGNVSNDGSTLAIIHLVANSEASIPVLSDLSSMTTDTNKLSPNLTISTCQFVRPTETETANIHLVKVDEGEFNMEAVSFSDDNNTAKFSTTPFLFDKATKVTLIASTLNNIESSASAVVKIVGKTSENIEVNVHGCTFTNCKSTEEASNATSGALYVESDQSDSKFNIGESKRFLNAATTFTSCECANGKSGGIYLKMPKITNANQLTWSEEEKLTVSGCKAGSDKQTFLFLEVDSGKFKEIAEEMKKKFAKNYVEGTNDWFVAAKGADESEDEDIDFTSVYFDPHEAYVQSGANDEKKADGTKGKPFSTIKKAYELLEKSKGPGEFSIKILKENENSNQAALKAEAVTFSKETGITIEGVVEAEETGNEADTKVEIDCGEAAKADLFTCTKTVTFMNLIFDFPAKQEDDDDGSDSNGTGPFALIHAVASAENELNAEPESVSLTIESCEFKRPTPAANSDGMLSNTGDETVEIHLVKVSAGTLTMNKVECTSDNEVKFSTTPFLVDGTITTVSLTSLNLKKITSKDSAVVKIVGNTDAAISVKLDTCTFTECKSENETTATTGALFVKSEHAGSTFSVEDNGKTKFENCTCTKGKSGAIYLELKNVTNADELTWPETGTNLEFTGCKVSDSDATSNAEKNTGLYLDVPVSLHRDIAKAMKQSFASGYKKGTNKCFVVAKGTDNENEVDFTEVYFDPITNVYVSEGATDDSKDGLSYDNPKKKLDSAYKLFGVGVGGENFKINIIKTNESFKAAAVTLEKFSLTTIVGVTKANEEESETEVEIDCNVESDSHLFTCKSEVEFRGISFLFPLSLDKTKESNTDPHSLIVADCENAKLNLVNCKFVKPEPVAPSNDEKVAKIHLVYVKAGELTMSGVECKGNNEVKFQESLFVISESSSVKFDTVEINKVSMTDGAAINILDAADKASSVQIEGLTMNEVKSSKGLSAGVMIKMVDNGSKVEMGRDKKCSFKSCEAASGKAGAILIEVKDAVGNLKLPGEGKLEFGDNKGKDSSVASLCIIAPDFDEYSKQEDAFGFAKDYNDDNKGWIVGAKEEGGDLEDVYEKYLKHKEPKDEPEPEKKKMMSAGTVVAIVVPIVVVVVVVVVVIIAIVVVRKRRSRNN